MNFSAFKKRTVRPFQNLFLLVTVLLFVFCERNNPRDINSPSYNPGTKPHATFVNKEITAFLYDSVTIKIACSDTAVGGDKGAIKKFYFTWQKDSSWVDSLNGSEKDTFELKKTFAPGVVTVRVKALDYDGQYSDIDSMKLDIILSKPVIDSIQVPSSVQVGMLCTLSVFAKDTGGYVNSYMLAKDGSNFYDSTLTGSFVVSYSDTGKKTLLVKVQDNKGIVSATDTVYLGVSLKPDSVGPEILFISPKTGDTIGTQNATLFLQATDENNVVSLSVNSVKFGVVGVVWKGEVALQEGLDTLIATAIDGRKNKSVKVIYVHYVPGVQTDRVTPIAYKIPAHSGDTINTPFATIRLKAASEAGIASVTINDSIMIKDTADTMYRFTVPLVEGKNFFIVKSVDKKGSFFVDTLIVFHQAAIIDTVPPVITMTAPKNNSQVSDSLVVVSGIASDGSGISSIKVQGVETYKNNPAFNTKVKLTHGSDTIRIVAVDSSARKNTAYDSVIVVQNIPPKFTLKSGVLDTSIGVNTTYEASIKALDVDNDFINFKFLKKATRDNVESALETSGGNATVRYTPVAAGIDTFQVEVRDNWNGTDTISWRVIVSASTDSVPVFISNKTSILDTVSTGSSYVALIKAKDPQNLPLTYSLVKPSSPQTMAIDQSGSIFWLPLDADTGKVHVIVMVSNGKQSDTLGWIITVQAHDWPPVLTNPGNKTVDRLKTVAFALSATDKNGDLLDYSFGKTFPSGATLLGSVFSWTPGVFDAGPHDVDFVVTEKNRAVPLSDTQRIVITVTNANVPPILLNPGNKSVSVNQNLAFALLATDADNNAITYSMKNAPAGATLTGNQFSWTPTVTQVGSIQISFKATDNATPPLGDSLVVNINVTLSNIAPVLANPGDRSVKENQWLQFNLSATDANKDSITYKMVGAPVGATLTNAQFNWTPTFAQAGTYSVKFIASDVTASPLSDSQTITITVVNVNNPPVLSTIAAKSVYATEQVSFSLAATDPNGDVVSFSVVNPPDGSTFLGTQFKWTPTYAQASGNAYNVKFLAIDNGTPAMSDTLIVPITVSLKMPATPDPFWVDAPTTNSIRANWTLVSGATSYIIYYKKGSTVDATSPSSVVATTSPMTISSLDAGTGYSFVIVSVNGAGKSAISYTQSLTTIPATPTISSVNAGDATVTVNWGTVNGATGYNIYYAQGNSVNTSGTKVTVSGGASTSKSIGLPAASNGNQYAFVVSAVIGTVESGLSGVKFATPQLSVPNVPTGLKSTSGIRTIKVEWVPAASGPTPASYTVYYNSGNTLNANPTKVSNLKTTSYTATGLSDNTQYAFAVSAENSANGSSARTAIVTDYTFPASPVQTAAVAGDGKATVNWGAVAGATSYNIVVTNTGSSVKKTLSVSGQATNSYVVTSLDNDVTYSFTISAVNGQGESAPSNVQTAKPRIDAPIAPTGFTATTQSSTTVNFTWAASARASSYIVYDVTSTTRKPVDTTSSTSGQVGTLLPGTAYKFAVVASNATGTSALSNSDNATTITSAPVLKSAVPFDGKVVVTLNATVFGAASYMVYYGIDNLLTKSSLHIAVPTGQLFVTIPLTNNTKYYFAATAINAGGESELSTVKLDATPIPVLGKPTITTSITDNVVTVSWTALTGADSCYVYYNVGSTISSSTKGKKVAATSPTTVTLSSPAAGATYAFAVTAWNSSGESDQSLVQTVVTTPSKPAITVSKVSADGNVTISWSKITGADSYNLYYNVGSTITSTTPISQSSTATSTTITLPTDGNVTYAFALSAKNSSGESAQSPVVTTVTLPGIPTAVTAGSITSNSVSIGWTNPTNGAVTYSVYNGSNKVGISSASSPIVINGLTAGTSYSYSVIATNTSGNSSASASVAFTTIPSTPTNISVDGNTTTSLTVNWNKVTGATDGYIINITDPTISSIAVSGQATESYSVTGLTSGTTYTFTITAVGVSGNSGNSSPVSGTTIPDAPTGVNVLMDATAATATVSWVKVTGATKGYKINVKNADGTSLIVTKNESNPNSVTSVFSIDGTLIQFSTEYKFEVIAIGAGGSSVASTINGTTPAAPTPVVSPAPSL